MSIFTKGLLSGKRFIFDGAMGTMLQRRGLPAGKSPEVFCLENPDTLEGIHADYIKAGADILTTNTFGGTSFKLPAGIKVEEFNYLMAKNAKKAALASGREVLVAGSIGPTGHFLAPLGELPFKEMVQAFRDQIRGLVAGGADLLIAETQFDIAETRAIVFAARQECKLPIITSMTYEEGKTLTGSGVEVCTATLANMGVDVVGMNCSAGPVEMEAGIKELLASSPVPTIVQPNAGLPELRGGETVFPLQPEPFAQYMRSFAEAGVQILGGCCGTSPEHIKALKQALSGVGEIKPRPERQGIVLSSRSDLVRIGRAYPVALIGERINPTGKKELTAQFQSGDLTEALRFADEQLKCGARVLDVNTGAPMVDESILLPALVSRLQVEYNAPLALDSPNAEALAKALEVYPASPLVNSISGEKGRMDDLGPLCRDFGAPFILLPLEGSQLPEKASHRIKIIESLLQKMDDLSIPRYLALVDVLALSVSSTSTAAMECLEVVRYCTEELGLPTTCGLSNISFGLPAREILNTSFFTMATAFGLSSCIANPSSSRLVENIDAANLFLGHDDGANDFIETYASWHLEENSASTKPKTKKDGQGGGQGLASFSPMGQAVIEGKSSEIVKLVQKAVDDGLEPFAIVNDHLIPAITEVGVKYEKKEYFLPQLIRSAETMQKAFKLLRPLLEEDQRSGERPVIVMATVEGDIHDIGKNIVSLMLGNHGFDVKDLGKDVPAEKIVDAAMEHGAGLIGLSALMTTTMVRMEDTLALIKDRGLHIKVLVGGAVVTDAFAQSIGAHYSKDAVEAVRVAKKLIAG